MRYMFSSVVFEDGRLSILRLEQLLKGKITSNTTFQVKAATGGIGTGGGGGGGGHAQQLENDVEVSQAVFRFGIHGRSLRVSAGVASTQLLSRWLVENTPRPTEWTRSFLCSIFFVRPRSTSLLTICRPRSPPRQCTTMIKSAPPPPSPAYFLRLPRFRGQAVLVGCLRRLRVVRPAGLFELLAAIEVLRFELEHRPAVVVVDGMGSFFWQDKVTTWGRGCDGGGGTGGGGAEVVRGRRCSGWCRRRGAFLFLLAEKPKSPNYIYADFFFWQYWFALVRVVLPNAKRWR